MNTIAEAAAALTAHDRILLLTHLRPDGDSLCSAAALCSALRRMGKTAALFPNPEITDTYAGMVAAYLAPPAAAWDYIVSVDVAGPEMLPLGFSGAVDLCIDHHPSNPGFAALTVLGPDKASCGEVVLALVERLCPPLTPEEANLLYAAVSTDSGCFRYGNTTAETLRAAAHLIDCGADSHRLNKELFLSSSPARLRLEGMIYSDIHSYRNNQINFAVVTLQMMREAGTVEDDCEDLASLPGRIRGGVVNITIRELEENRCKASVRTNELVDASVVCRKLGGGGHKMAAGCTLSVSPAEMERLLLAAVDEVWPA
jgi:phosphoesterase RecJ-like protein